MKFKLRLRELCALCRLILPHHHPRRRASVTLVGAGIVAVTFGDDDMATVRNDGGPLEMDISAFVDDKGNPVKDTDAPTFSSSDETIATIAADTTDPQKGIITLTGLDTPEGVAVVCKASFPAQKYGQPFDVVANLIVVDPAAASAQATISGPGVVDGA